MADPSEKPDETTRSGRQESAESPPASGQAPASGPQQEQRVPVNIDESRLTAVYSNFCRVTGTPEEVILDFAVNSQPFEVSTQPIAVTQRIILSPMTAKRLTYALGMSVERHEATFGVLETNVVRRLRTGGPDQPQQPAAPF